jgi:hypothetical protein
MLPATTSAPWKDWKGAASVAFPQKSMPALTFKETFGRAASQTTSGDGTGRTFRARIKGMPSDRFWLYVLAYLVAQDLD